jgi:hypothetical protein
MGGAVGHPVIPLSVLIAQLFGIAADISMAIRNPLSLRIAPEVCDAQFFLNCGRAKTGLGIFPYRQD